MIYCTAQYSPCAPEIPESVPQRTQHVPRRFENLYRAEHNMCPGGPEFVPHRHNTCPGIRESVPHRPQQVPQRSDNVSPVLYTSDIVKVQATLSCHKVKSPTCTPWATHRIDNVIIGLGHAGLSRKDASSSTLNFVRVRTRPPKPYMTRHADIRTVHADD